ncbi:DNA gyrase inhibitor YacG [Dissulfurispira thermophila]|uniref:DNA gyrase inhibitor YacG n=2 Tax=root TaxID=1 RepID=A0A7G1H296_9BACT|nr:DNA gyrase inhibitor YacG [Dissulfurispira thermophila]BCB96251.1 DNA gyrase inhibitor YacG [Dissulfurispira thermophila]
MQIICPVCKKKTTWEENPWRPFCSERCKLIDLGKWASEEYKIHVGDKEEREEKEKKIMDSRYSEI